jgi:glycerophosphoryl diester phosphodiesterase
MKIISHRGAAGLALENSIESLNKGLKLPVYALEIDIRATRDGELILLHDTHTGHVANRTLLPQNSTLEELKKLTLHNGERIPTLEEVFKLVGKKKRLMIDIKSSGVAEEALRLIKKYSGVDVFFTGLQYNELKKIHQSRPDITFLVQHHHDPLEIIHKATAMGARGISLNMWLINPLTYHLARVRGLDVYLYTVNNPLLVHFFKRLYPEVFIITNHPDKFV